VIRLLGSKRTQRMRDRIPSCSCHSVFKDRAPATGYEAQSASSPVLDLPRVPKTTGSGQGGSGSTATTRVRQGCGRGSPPSRQQRETLMYLSPRSRSRSPAGRPPAQRQGGIRFPSSGSPPGEQATEPAVLPRTSRR
jgi:hypothetical protein